MRKAQAVATAVGVLSLVAGAAGPAMGHDPQRSHPSHVRTAPPVLPGPVPLPHVHQHGPRPVPIPLARPRGLPPVPMPHLLAPDAALQQGSRVVPALPGHPLLQLPRALR